MSNFSFLFFSFLFFSFLFFSFHFFRGSSVCFRCEDNFDRVCGVGKRRKKSEEKEKEKENKKGTNCSLHPLLPPSPPE